MARGRTKPTPDPPRQLDQAKAAAKVEFKLPDYLRELLLESEEWRNFGQEDDLLVQGHSGDNGKDVADGVEGAAPVHPQESKDAAGAASGSGKGTHCAEVSRRCSGEKRGDAKGGSDNTECKQQAWCPEYMPQHYSSDLLWQHPPFMVPTSQFRWVVSEEGRYAAPLRRDLAPPEVSVSCDGDQQDSYQDPSTALQRLLGEYYNPLASTSVREASRSYMRSHHEHSVDSSDEAREPHCGQPRTSLDGQAAPFAEEPMGGEAALSPVVTRPPLAARRTLPGGQVSPEVQLLQSRASSTRRASNTMETPPITTPRSPPKALTVSPLLKCRFSRGYGLLDRASTMPQASSMKRRLILDDEPLTEWLGTQALPSETGSSGVARAAGVASPTSPSPKAFSNRVVHELAAQLERAPAVRAAAQSPRLPATRVPTPCARPSPPTTPLPAPARPVARSPVLCGVASPSRGRVSRVGLDRPQHPPIEAWRAAADGMPRRPHSVATTAPHA